MKILLVVITLLCFSCAGKPIPNLKAIDSSITTTAIYNDTIFIACEQPDVSDLITTSDTIIDYSNRGDTIKSYNKEKRLIRISFSKTYENNSKNFNSFTTIYDTSGRIIYEDKTQGFTRWHCYSYKYDANDHLVYKEGYSSGEMGI